MTGLSVFWFHFRFLHWVSDLRLVRSFQVLWLYVDFSVACSDFVDFSCMFRNQEVTWFKAHMNHGSPCPLASGFVFWHLERKADIFKSGYRIPIIIKSNSCDIFISGFLLERVRVLQFHLNLTLCGVSISDHSSSNVSLLQKTPGIKKALGTRDRSRWICPFRWVFLSKKIIIR